MTIKANFGLFTFPLEPQAYGSLLQLRAGDILDIRSFELRRSTATLSLFEPEITDEKQLVHITGAELNAADLQKKANTKQQQVRRDRGPKVSRRKNITDKIYAHVQLYTNSELIRNFAEDQSDFGYAALAINGNFKLDGKDYKIDYRYAEALLNETAGFLEDIYWEIHLIKS